MYQLTINLNRISGSIFKLNLIRTCSSKFCLIKNSILNNQQSQNELNKLQNVRNLSLTSINLFQEKEKKATKDDVLIGEIKEKETSIKKAQKFIREYGKIGFVVYISVSLTMIAIFYVLISLNVDVNWIINEFGLNDKLAELLAKYENGSKFIVAYCISKVLLPVRLAISIFFVSMLKRFIKF